MTDKNNSTPDMTDQQITHLLRKAEWPAPSHAMLMRIRLGITPGTTRHSDVATAYPSFFQRNVPYFAGLSLCCALIIGFASGSLIGNAAQADSYEATSPYAPLTHIYFQQIAQQHIKN